MKEKSEKTVGGREGPGSLIRQPRLMTVGHSGIIVLPGLQPSRERVR
jgi:hypothetical protein